ncbi:restriction endonuclease subunit S [Enterococcus villorum]|uniref:restriction endonuclease subunit S n=1 Tax=Enterococcus villorum TaxID=112904 RepID=UPI003B839E3D
MKSTDILQLTSFQLGNYKIYFPSIDEQVKINTFCKRLADTIAFNQHKLERLRLLKQGFLQKMFVTHGRFPEVRFAKFNEEWEQCKLNEFIYFHTFF